MSWTRSFHGASAMIMITLACRPQSPLPHYMHLPIVLDLGRLSQRLLWTIEVYRLGYLVRCACCSLHSGVHSPLPPRPPGGTFID
jgi:hypothetical protein